MMNEGAARLAAPSFNAGTHVEDSSETEQP